ncbi:uncharacterized protein LOC131605700 [Vicia villosa]|uniref:uncharacterized protein LOC131605700 n=1 Tax=Vicia villosa TaxID=3911 RepID=UPI00273C6C31|nr:uncharacterized protein LOC131605700 [Vicia villosa]
MGVREGMIWKWNLQVQQGLENDLVLKENEDLELILEEIEPIQNMQDRFIWSLNGMEGFKVYAYYSRLLDASVVEDIKDDIRLVSKAIWTLKMPSKIKIFAWRLVQNRLPTRLLLRIRGIIVVDYDSLCVFGFQVREDNHHLFSGCPKTRKLWEMIQSWLGINVQFNSNFVSFYCNFVEAMKVICKEKDAGGIWGAACWAIWKQRNNIIFNNAVEDFDEIFHDTKILSWQWQVLGTKEDRMCAFYDWYHHPNEVLAL